MAVTKQAREKYWRELQERQAASGLSARAWCVRETIAYATFMYWRRRLGRTEAVEPLTLIRVTEGEVVGDGLWLSVGGVRIEVKAGLPGVNYFDRSASIVLAGGSEA